jgi:hypothetical protein
VTAPSPGRVLRLALVAWGLGHVALGRTAAGWAWLAAEAVAIALIAWLTLGLIDSSAYLVPFLAGAAFLAAWAWQAVAAYRLARRSEDGAATADRSPAAAIGWLSLPLLVWGTGYWVVAGHAATPAAVVDQFVTDWTSRSLGDEWSPDVVRAAGLAADRIGDADTRTRLDAATDDGSRATMVVESIHFERRAATFLGVFPGSQLVPVADGAILTLELRSVRVPLGGGDIGAVRWELVSAHP